MNGVRDDDYHTITLPMTHVCGGMAQSKEPQIREQHTKGAQWQSCEKNRDTKSDVSDNYRTTS